MAKTKLNSELIDALCEALDVPMTADDAARFVGISPRTLKGWLEKAESEDCDDELLLQLSKRVSEVMTGNASKRGQLMTLAMAQAVADPKMAMFMIERLMPSMTLTKNVRVDATVAPKAPTVDYSMLTEEEIATLKAGELIKARLGSGN